MLNAIKYMDELEQKGFTKEQAKTSVNLWIELMNENLASKNDLQEVKSEIKEVIHKMDKDFLSIRHEIQEVRHAMKDMESRLTLKLSGFMATALTLLAIFLKL